MGISDLFRKYGAKDYIYMLFNPETNKYEYHLYRDTAIPYKKLDKESRQKLDAKNEELIKNPNLINEEIAKIEHEKKEISRAKELAAMGYSCGSTIIMSDKPLSPIPEAFSKTLDNMLSEEHVLYGICRTGMSLEYIKDALENGLIMTGHGFNVSQSAVSLHQNVGYYPDNMQVKEELLNAHGYKGSHGSLLIRIPDEDLKAKNLFIERQGEFKRLNPKYIVGYVPIMELPNGTVTIDRIFTLQDLRKKEESVETPTAEIPVVEQTYEEESVETNTAEMPIVEQTYEEDNNQGYTR